MSDLVLISLFDGIGGFPLAARQNGIRTAVVVEIDRAAAGVTAEHFPDAIHFSDITEVTADDLIRALSDAGIDVRSVRIVFAGGWPCQDLSLAGRRLGLGGARSGLFFEIVRLISELATAGVQLECDLRPRWLVLENVPGLLSACCSCPGLGRCAGGCTDPHPVPGGDCGRRRARLGLAGRGRCMELHGGAMGAVLGSLVELGYGVAYRVLDAQYFGVPQRRRRVVLVGHLGDDGGAPTQVLLEPEGGGGNLAASGAPEKGAAVRPAGVADGARREVVSAIGLSGIGGNGGPDDNAAQGGHLVTVDHAVTVGGGPGHQGPNGHGMAGVNAQEVQAGHIVPMAFGHTAGLDHQASENRTPTLRAGHTSAAGGAVMTATLTAGMGSNAGAPGDAGKDDLATATARAGAAVRRLTPVECERLQGYPDGWTSVSAGVEQADSPRYRELGNSIAVPVFSWVMGRIVAYEQEGR